MKKLTALFFAVMLLVTATVTAAADTVEVDFNELAYQKYDINCDFEIDTNDMAFLKKILLGVEQVKYEPVTDLNGDGNVDVIDLIIIKKHFAK